MMASMRPEAKAAVALAALAIGAAVWLFGWRAPSIRGMLRLEQTGSVKMCAGVGDVRCGLRQLRKDPRAP
jgi:hypothetical protein